MSAAASIQPRKKQKTVRWATPLERPLGPVTSAEPRLVALPAGFNAAFSTLSAEAKEWHPANVSQGTTGPLYPSGSPNSHQNSLASQRFASLAIQ
ncbi:hypothetical protein KEM54_005356 [Ascosphaera aggregata]|nr:hypothetical protein KEM54_005356 [Ascosphaera aggregata]